MSFYFDKSSPGLRTGVLNSIWCHWGESCPVEGILRMAEAGGEEDRKPMKYSSEWGGFTLMGIKYKNPANKEDQVKIASDDRMHLLDLADFISDHVRSGKVQCIVAATYVISKPGFEAFGEARYGGVGNRSPPPTMVYHGAMRNSGMRDANTGAKALEALKGMGLSLDNLTMECVEPSYRPRNNHLRRSTMGTFHPKFCLIFMTDGLAISITTSNLTRSVSLEGAWTAFVPRSQNAVPTEFGVHLQKFLESCEEQRESCLRKPELLSKFLSDHALFPLDSLHREFDFSALDGKVRLVSSVPGRRTYTHDFQSKFDNLEGQLCKACKAICRRITPPSEAEASRDHLLNKDIKYGSFRIEEIVQAAPSQSSVVQNTDPAEPYDSNAERKKALFRPLVVQTTSTGTKLDTSFMRTFLDNLLPDNDPEVDRGEMLRIIWAHKDHQNLPGKGFGGDKNRVVVGVDVSEYDDMRGDGTSMKFVHPNAFITIFQSSPRCLHHWENLVDYPKDENDSKHFAELVMHTHHIKTILRQDYEDNFTREKRNKEEKCCCWKLNWCLLSSACLSIGAQGVRGPISICYDKSCPLSVSSSLNEEIRRKNQANRDDMSFTEHRNFELGVMFVSDENTQYRALHGDCVTHSPNFPGSQGWTKCWRPNGQDATPRPEVVVLPIPYRLDSQSYHDLQGNLLLLPGMQWEGMGPRDHEAKYYDKLNLAEELWEKINSEAAARAVLQGCASASHGGGSDSMVVDSDGTLTGSASTALCRDVCGKEDAENHCHDAPCYPDDESDDLIDEKHTEDKEVEDLLGLDSDPKHKRRKRGGGGG